MRHAPESGFTLIEVMVALGISGIVLLTAHTLVSQTSADAERIAAVSTRLDREANGPRLLRTLLGRADARGDTLVAFTGLAHAARFRSWCESPAGWLERCDVMLGLVSAGGENVLALSGPSADAIPLRSGFRDGRLLYLGSVDRRRWLTRWGSSHELPLAVGIVIDGDTSIYPVRGGAR